MAFAVEFLKIYDRKIASGEITFSKSGITAGDFTCMCTTPGFVMSEENLARVCDMMKLSEEEKKILYSEAGYL